MSKLYAKGPSRSVVGTAGKGGTQGFVVDELFIIALSRKAKVFANPSLLDPPVSTILHCTFSSTTKSQSRKGKSETPEEAK